MDRYTLDADDCREGGIDLAVSNHPEVVLHVWPDQFAAFVHRAKAGHYDHLCMPDGAGTRTTIFAAGMERAMRYREDTPEELNRARAAVAAWHEQHPGGTAEELEKTVGPQFHPGYGPVLRGILFALDGDGPARIGMDIALEAELVRVRRAHCTRWDSIGQRQGEIGWWASRQIGPGTWHHIVCRTLRELDKELIAEDAGEDPGPVTE